MYKLFNNNKIRNCSKLNYNTDNNNSKVVRQKFLDFFIKDNNHNFVRSSPILPYNDNSLAFVNAGMNQFKGILSGSQKPQFLKVANSQKCIRIGGKHNDLDLVGSDGYHHTFFEMLGNWSFGDYFKKEACELAWKLLTEVYKIDKQILYVTYFKGDKLLNLPPDNECKEIWKSIGVAESRILPFGLNENFWEMGSTGPCGPCTEIHVDRKTFQNRAELVNKGLPDLTELWNIVFIQFLRNPDKSITPLSVKHVDTGMGLERLCALMQGKSSNYDTDLFTPLFKAVHKISKKVPEYGGKYGKSDLNFLDTNYRIIADHARMITASLADGMVPEQNQKLRKIMRKVYSISESCFKVEKALMKDLSNYVVEILGSTYPEMEKNIKVIHQIIDHEEEIYKSIRKNSTSEWKKIIEISPELSSLDVIEMPGLIAAYKELKTSKITSLTPRTSFKLFDAFGLDLETIKKLSVKMNIDFNPDDLLDELQKAKEKSRQSSFVNINAKFLDELEKCGVINTDDSYKYSYERKNINEYDFKPVNVKVLKIIKDGRIYDRIEPNEECTIVLDKSNLYTEAGGQSSDRGRLELDERSNYFEIFDVQKEKGFVLHAGVLKSENALESNVEGILRLNEQIRLNNMRNHTVVHILNSSLKKLKGATSQKSSKVTPNFFNLDVCIYGPKLTKNEIESLEREVKNVIKSQTDVNIKKINSQQFLSLDNLITVPGEYYPEIGIRLVEINDTKNGFLSREPCSGTHVLNTIDIGDFCIIKVQSLGRSTTSIYGVTNERALKAQKNGQIILEKITNLKKSLQDNMDNPEILDSEISIINKKLNHDLDDEHILPYTVKAECKIELNKINKQIEEVTKSSLRKFVEEEMLNVMENKVEKTKNNQPYVIHYLRCSTMLDNVPLQNATKLTSNIPTIVISYSNNIVKARCCVPKSVKNENFDAEKWLSSTVCSIFDSTITFTATQDLSLICNMKKKKINIKDWDSLLRRCLAAAKEYVENNL